jgi:hypothetical protein
VDKPRRPVHPRRSQGLCGSRSFAEYDEGKLRLRLQVRCRILERAGSACQCGLHSLAEETCWTTGKVLCLTLRGWAGFPLVSGDCFEVLLLKQACGYLELVLSALR